MRENYLAENNKVVPPGFVPPGLAKKCGNTDPGYPEDHPGGPRDGWEKEHKKKHWEFHYTNDISYALPQVIQVTEDDPTKWKEIYTYGVGMTPISMTYLPAYDDNNGWEPSPGVGGAEPGVTPKTLYYITDILGTNLGLMEQDGRMSSRYHYDEFGVVLDTKKFDINWPGPDNLIGYTGLEYDYYTDLNYARARYYKPEIGRFISEDTYRGDQWNPLSQNRFTYVLNNSLKFTDPSGYYPYIEFPYLGEGVIGVTRMIWEEVLIPSFIEPKGYELTIDLLTHSLEENPESMIINSGYTIGLINANSSYSTLINELVTKANENRQEEFEYSSSLVFTDGDLFAALNKVNINIEGNLNLQTGLWKLKVNITDTYDFTEFKVKELLGDKWEEWAANDLALISQVMGAINSFDVTIQLQHFFKGWNRTKFGTYF